MFNEEDVKRTFEILGYEKLEFRPLDLRNSKAYPTEINTTDPEIIDFIKSHNGKMNLYVGINKRNFIPASIQHIETVKTIVLDIDATRSAGNEKQACTDEELNYAKETATLIFEWLKKEYDDCLPSLAMSGNGYQVWIPISPINCGDKSTEMLDEKIKAFHSIIIQKYSSKQAKIDNIGDLPRIIKVIGSLSIKGEATTERPHRLSKWEIYNGRQKQSKKLLMDILRINPEKVKASKVETKVSVEDEEILKHRKYDYKLDKLLNGDITGYPSNSEGELALACKLVFYRASESQVRQIMDNAFLQNWNNKSEHYKEKTIKKAFELTSGRWIEPAKEINDDLAEKMDVNVSDPQIKITWASWFDMFVWNSPELAEAYLLSTVSMMLKKNDTVMFNNKSIDPRVHMMVIQPPGSGKSKSVKIVQEVLNILNSEANCNYNLTIRTKLTSDASIVGTWRGLNADEKRKLKDGEFVDGLDNGQVWVPGDLQVADMLFLGEASNILCDDVKNRDLREIQNSLLEAMNDGGLISKKKAESSEKTYYCHSNILLFSRPTSEMIKNPEVLIASGMMRRCIPIFKDKSRSERLEDISKFHEILTNGNGSVNYTFTFRQIEKYIRAIHHFTSTKKIIEIESDAIKFSETFIKNLFHESKNKFFEDYVCGSILNYVWVLGSCFCAIRCSTEEDTDPKIKLVDIMRSCKFINLYVDGTLRFLETQDKKIDLFNQGKKITLLRSIIKEKSEWPLEELITEMCSKSKYSRRTIQEFLNKDAGITQFLEKCKDPNDKRSKIYKVK
jgi:hypothetical protein